MENTGNFKVFITDDDIFCLNMYEQYLSELQYIDLSLFHNGQSCLDNLKLKPDLIFLDHNMANMNGLEVLKKIKEISPQTHVVMVSSQESINIAITSLKFGAFDYVVKDSNVSLRLKNIVMKVYLLKNDVNKNESSGSMKFRFFK